MKTFHLGDILTLILARQLSPSAPGLSAVNALMDHVHGRRVPWTEIGGGAMATAADHLRTQFPALADLRLPDGANRADWLEVQVSNYGRWHQVQPMPALVSAAKEN